MPKITRNEAQRSWDVFDRAGKLVESFADEAYRRHPGNPDPRVHSEQAAKALYRKLAEEEGPRKIVAHEVTIKPAKGKKKK